MSTSPAFEWVCAELVRSTELSDLQARGIVRHLLSDAGLDARTLRKKQLHVLLNRRLHVLLKARRIAHDDSLGSGLADALQRAAFDETSEPDSPENIFERLGR